MAEQQLESNAATTPAPAAPGATRPPAPAAPGAPRGDDDNRDVSVHLVRRAAARLSNVATLSNAQLAANRNAYLTAISAGESTADALDAIPYSPTQRFREAIGAAQVAPVELWMAERERAAVLNGSRAPPP